MTSSSPRSEDPRPSGPPADTVARQRKAVIAAGIGTGIEYFDFTIYAFLATSIATVFFPEQNSTTALLSTWAVYAVSFFLRPIGGILIGHLGDRYGRKRALSVAVIGMAMASFLIGVIPGYRSIGLAGAVCLVILRCIQGLSAGGELGTASSYMAEVAPIKRRGYHMGFVQMGTIGGTVLGALFISIMREVATGDQITSWAWRIPFLCSLPLGIIALVVRMRMEESVQFEDIRKRHHVKRAPLATLLKEHRRSLLAVTLLALTSNGAYWIVFTYLGSYFETQDLMSAKQASWMTTITLALGLVTLPLWSRLSDRVGRRPVMIGGNAAFVVLAYPMFILMGQSVAWAIIAELILGQITIVYLSAILVTLTEMFPTSVRVSGFALGYNIAAVLAGGSAPYIATWLIGHTGNPRSPALFLIVATGLALIGAVFVMRETANKPLPVDSEIPDAPQTTSS